MSENNTELRIVIPEQAMLYYNRGAWYILGHSGWIIPIETSYAEMLQSAFLSMHNEQEQRYRHSFYFRWRRFWYLWRVTTAKKWWNCHAKK